MTWDVDSRDRSLCARLHRFVFGYVLEKSGRKYGYPGFVEREGVRYLGQSVLFVIPERLEDLRGFLRAQGVEHVTTNASLGETIFASLGYDPVRRHASAPDG
ncbi:MAG TPA: hypothetical protein VF992_01190 [Thermoplasmata archaeon]